MNWNFHSPSYKNPLCSYCHYHTPIKTTCNYLQYGESGCLCRHRRRCWLAACRQGRYVARLLIWLAVGGARGDLGENWSFVIQLSCRNEAHRTWYVGLKERERKCQTFVWEAERVIKKRLYHFVSHCSRLCPRESFCSLDTPRGPPHRIASCSFSFLSPCSAPKGPSVMLSSL